MHVDFGASRGRYNADELELLARSHLRDAAGERDRFYFRVHLRPGDGVLRLQPLDEGQVHIAQVAVRDALLGSALVADEVRRLRATIRAHPQRGR